MSSYDTDAVAPGASQDPAARLQLQILRQVAPVLTVRPLRRLLDMHDVRYKDTDNLKKLRRRLSSFVDRLERGKQGEDDLVLTGTARNERRKESRRLRAEWPQVIPEHLKRNLRQDFLASGPRPCALPLPLLVPVLAIRTVRSRTRLPSGLLATALSPDVRLLGQPSDAVHRYGFQLSPTSASASPRFPRANLPEKPSDFSVFRRPELCPSWMWPTAV
ncbi:hypothetical protein C8R47DRAFT_1217638 [Mycena vitilis]|nr:hypothetical protein C8R47DRAFT_1217638 [Mycena vitilis]